ncbi:MAG: phosphoglycolate phosphatase [Planctomycetota bacterium]
MLLNFDYDGVIVDSFDQLLSLVIQAQQSLGLGRPPIAEDFRKIENLAFEDLGRRIGLPENQVFHYEARIFELQKEQWDVRPFSRIVPIFEKLAMSHTLVVITSSQSEAVAATLESFGLGSAVSRVLGGELGSTKAERIEQSRREFSCSAQDTFMVGDAISDIRQGKLAGVKTIAVSWGYQDRELLERERPDFIFDNPDELLQIGM